MITLAPDTSSHQWYAVVITKSAGVKTPSICFTDDRMPAVYLHAIAANAQRDSMAERWPECRYEVWPLFAMSFYFDRQRWLSGSNMPGYLPDDTPNAHDTFEVARASIIIDIERDIEMLDIMNPGAHADLQDLKTIKDDAAKVRADKSFTLIANGRAYWVTKE